ncbi:glycosyltransferase family 39 protein [Actinocorallia sp. API 0066]|uniref:glycosyltransferase family 39 protein n=1 Tax=Actinocorallia sp. API 0066 TaxID=2896846 RepID=UPI001E2D2534|nr:glycosyltransferase family 39 protein [Actinocorallia sp. API 0066]MCD0451079.1 glycosyltransferase family 39 protein [Actinocorallia sp. API 0066]
MSGALVTRQDSPRRYTLPVTPPVAWSAEPSRRRRRFGAAALLAVLALQAVLTLRLDNTASPEEALYLAVAQAGGSLGSHAEHLPGAPFLYPFLVAPLDAAFGLEGARALSLALMLVASALVYGFARRLFGLRPALMAVASFAVVASTTFTGGIATSDALSVFLLSCAIWALIRFAHSAAAVVLLAGPLCVLAFVANYAAAVVLPFVVLTAAVACWPRAGGGRACARAAVLTVVVGVGIVAFVIASDVGAGVTAALTGGVGTALTGGVGGADVTGDILWRAAEYSGLYVALTLFGTLMYWRKGPLTETPGVTVTGPRPGVRLAIGLVLTIPALLVPFYQAGLGTIATLPEHLGYATVLAAPMVGLGMSWLLGRHFRSPQFPIAAWLALFALGFGQAGTLMAAWPHSADMVSLVRPELTAEGTYLSSTPQVPIYTIGADGTRAAQWTATEGFTDLDAVQTGAFDLIVLDSGVAPDVNALIEERILVGGLYRLRATYKYDYGPLKGDYRIWVRLG